MDSNALAVLSRRSHGIFAGVAVATLLFSAGAAAQQKKDKMEVSTPWGGASVSGDAALKDLGLPAYPGARLYKEKPSDDPSATLSFWTSTLGFKLVVVRSARKVLRPSGALPFAICSSTSRSSGWSPATSPRQPATCRSSFIIRRNAKSTSVTPSADIDLTRSLSNAGL